MLKLLETKIKSLKTSLAKKILDKKIGKSNKTLTIVAIKSVLFLRIDDKIGDTVVSSFLYREIKKKYPNIKIVVCCGKNNKEILKYNKNVDELYEIRGCLFNDISVFKDLRKQNISLVVDFFPFNPNFNHILMLRVISPEFLIGFNKTLYKMYNLSVNENFFSMHITEMYKYILNLLKIDDIDLRYEIPLTSEEEGPALDLINNNYKCKYNIVINPCSSSKHRTLSVNKLKDLIDLIENSFDCCVFILCQEKNKQKFASLENDKTIIASFKSILGSSALIKYADIIITPDTSIVHIAAAFNKKSIALYRDYSTFYERTDIMWAPNNTNAIQLSVDTKSGFSNDVENIHNADILSALQKIL
ncbi:MAG: glycosyltransferase family 9 protein [Clostridiales Family XIII bacterium]|jgi:ADP-heptose:LPS heptosyltransferase|nr:glycosyltransferase family 9 protein [Clostridiales Family XIII bacterium]